MSLELRFLRASRVGAALCVALGIAVLVGWFARLSALTHLHPSMASMKANTACLLMLVGVGIWLTPRAEHAALRRGLGAFVALFAVATLAQYFLQVDFGIDRWIVTNPVRESLSPDRMAHATAIAFCGLGVGLVFADAPRARLAQLPLAISMATAVLALFGYAYDVRALYGVGAFTSMALHTAAALLIASVSLLLAQPTRGVMEVMSSQTRVGRSLRRLLPWIAVVPLTLGWLCLQGVARGYYEVPFGVAALVLVNMTTLTTTTLVVTRRLYRMQLQDANDRALLLRVTELLGNGGAPDDIMQATTRHIGEAFGATRTFFSVVDLANDRVTVRASHEPGLTPLPREHRFSSIAELVARDLRAGITVINHDAEHDMRTRDRFALTYAASGVRASVGIPMLSNGVLAGIFSVTSDRARVWEPREVALMTQLALHTCAWYEHRIAADRLFNSEARNSAVLRSSLDAIVLMDHEGVIVELNHVAESMFGHRRQDAIGRTLADLLVPEALRERHREGLKRYVSGGPPVVLGKVLELPALRASGEEFPVEVAIARVMDISPPLFTGFIRDISSRRAIEQDRQSLFSDLTQLTQQLEQRVEARTLELREAMTAQEMASAQLMAALREKEILIKEIHHRVKNNLQVISSLLHLQGSHLTDARARAMFSETQTRVQSIALVHEKLYQSRDLSHINFDDYVRVLVRGLLHSLNAEARGVTAHVEVHGVRLSVDMAVPCGMIVNELVTNALKHAFTDRAGGVVTVKLKHVDAKRVELVVSDNGRGLPPDVDPRRTTSLGLELVFAFADQVGATVSYRNEGGMAFHMVFPMESDHAS